VAGLVVAGGVLFWGDLGADRGPVTSSSARTSPSPSLSPSVSVEEFCDEFLKMRGLFTRMAEPVPARGLGTRLRERADAALASGPPSEMPTGAQAGFSLVMSAVSTLPDDAGLQDLETLDSILRLGDVSKADEFNVYVTDTCL